MSDLSKLRQPLDGSRCIYIIIPIFNRLENIPKIMKRLSNQTYQNFRLILVDHGTIRAPQETLPSGLIYLEGSSEDWWSGAINIGLRYVWELVGAKDTDYILLQNDDVDFDENFLNDLYESSLRENAVVSAITIDKESKRILDANNRLSYWRGQHTCALKHCPIEDAGNGFLEADILKGRGVLYPLSLTRKMGFVDEKLHYRADPEWSYRANRLGARLGVVPSIRVMTVLDTQEKMKVMSGMGYFKYHLFSKRSTQNVFAAWRYFRLCYGPVRGLVPFCVHSLLATIVATKRALLS